MGQKARRVGVIAYRNADGTFQDAREIRKYPGPETDPEELDEVTRTLARWFASELAAAAAERN